MRLIDADALVDELLKHSVVTDDLFGMGRAQGARNALTAICAAPTIDAVPVVRGEWIYDHYGGMWPAGLPRPEYKCSACQDWSMKQERNYCPNCGAKMEVKRDE